MQRRSALCPRKHSLHFLAVLVASLTLLGGTVPAAAAEDKYAAIVVDGNTGETLFARNADARRFPASLTKMMTLYVLFEELEAGRLSLDSKLSVSSIAAAQAPSKLGLRAGKTIKVEDAILGLTTKSANDAAVVIAENVSGSVESFADRMNRTARAVGMNSTTFRNPNGLPNPGQTTTARDFARLGAVLQERFPTYYKYFGARSFTYAGTKYRNHNRLLGSVDGVDGIKTGYTRASGFNLVSNVRRGDKHIIAVVMGGKTGASRDAHMRELIAKYMPAAKGGGRAAPLLVAEAFAGEGQSDTRVPRPRPAEQSTSALAFASPRQTPDIVAAAMAVREPAKPAPAAKAAAAAAVLPSAPAPEKPDAARIADPIAERIAIATEVARLATIEARPQGAADAAARLRQIAKAQAGRANAGPVAGPSRTVDPNGGEAGWHIQIGAVPTAEGAAALIEKAQNSVGPLLASAQAFTQEVERNGTTLFRARFAGFSDKEAARNACAQLKSKAISCLAVPN